MEFSEFAEDFLREVEEDQLEWLALVGEEAYDMAVSSRAFQDRTGCLLSSIGYAVVRDGKIRHEGGFRVILNGADGREKGLRLIRELMPKRGTRLIFVAGEHYATFVEANGYDVNTAGELIIDKLMAEWQE